ncbi:5404_t:CDS:2 [Racocetra fulgida]|uniref:5404_t:CDS:1 n=1 Tax=Racocetra fulgida TaxID=60492 RepID=A0A9N9BFN8_9GLOM|nr:5404_t:CDS:2 [Racocetra fulgida]
MGLKLEPGNDKVQPGNNEIWPGNNEMQPGNNELQPSNNEMQPDNNELQPVHPDNNDEVHSVNHNETQPGSNNEVNPDSNDEVHHVSNNKGRSSIRSIDNLRSINNNDQDNFLSALNFFNGLSDDSSNEILFNEHNDDMTPLDNTYNEFLKDFYACKNILSPAKFDLQWYKLIAKYLKAADYLNSELYSSKEKWAKAYTTKFFTAGITSTSRVKSENLVIKNILQGRPNLCELAAILDHVLEEYLTKEMLFRQRHEIAQSLYYYSKIKSNNLTDERFNEEGYDEQQIHLTSLLDDLSSNDVVKIYEVQ